MVLPSAKRCLPSPKSLVLVLLLGTGLMAAATLLMLPPQPTAAKASTVTDPLPTTTMKIPPGHSLTTKISQETNIHSKVQKFPATCNREPVLALIISTYVGGREERRRANDSRVRHQESRSGQISRPPGDVGEGMR